MGVARLFGLEYSIGGRDTDVAALDPTDADLAVQADGEGPAAEAATGEGRTTVFSWPDLGTFTVHDGREIRTDLADEASATAVRNVLVGICFGALLQQRGSLVLHGSVASVDGDAVAFVGNKRAGKSTAVAALLARGHDFLSDDIVAIRFAGGEPRAIPGFPMFKLDPETFDDAGLPATPAPDADTGTGKRYYELEAEFDWTPRPLSTITILEPGSDGPRRERLRGHDAAVALLEHAWPVRLQNAPYVEEGGESLDEPDLDRYARLVETCRIQRASLAHDHDSLDGLGRDLEALLE